MGRGEAPSLVKLLHEHCLHRLPHRVLIEWLPKESHPGLLDTSWVSQASPLQDGVLCLACVMCQAREPAHRHCMAAWTLLSCLCCNSTDACPCLCLSCQGVSWYLLCRDDALEAADLLAKLTRAEGPDCLRDCFTDDIICWGHLNQAAAHVLAGPLMYPIFRAWRFAAPHPAGDIPQKQQRSWLDASWHKRWLTVMDVLYSLGLVSPIVQLPERDMKDADPRRAVR